MPIRCASRTAISSRPHILDAGPLKVPMVKQEQTNWCWSACTVMILQFFGNRATKQCDVANWLLGQSGCCSSPGSTLCNQKCKIADVGSIHAHWNVETTFVSATVPFATLEAEIKAGRPVEVALGWAQGGGHVVIVVECSFINGEPVVRVNDPDVGSGGVTYEKLLTAYGSGRWNYTWTGIRG